MIQRVCKKSPRYYETSIMEAVKCLLLGNEFEESNNTKHVFTKMTRTYFLPSETQGYCSENVGVKLPITIRLYPAI